MVRADRDGRLNKFWKKRQRTAELQNLAGVQARAKTRQRLRVRLSSAAFYPECKLGSVAGRTYMLLKRRVPIDDSPCRN